MELHEIIDRTHEGDVQAFAELVRRYRDMAFGYALALVGREQTAEDAVQEAMLAAYANLDQLRDPRAFGAWLRGIVRHQCYRALRAEPETVSLDAMEHTDQSAPAETSPAVWDQVRTAIDGLPPWQQTIVRLHYEEGLSQLEIATKLGLTAAAVNMRLHSARSRLRRRLMTHEPTPTITPGRIQEVNGPNITVQFPPGSTPLILSELSGLGDSVLAVVQHLSAGRVLAVSPKPGAIWTPGQEVTDSCRPFAGGIAQEVVTQILGRCQSAKPVSPLVTGIKSIDLFAPMTQSGTTGIFTEWGLGVLVLLPEIVHHLDRDNNRQTILVFVPPLTDHRHWVDLNAEVTVGTVNLSILYLPVVDPIERGFVESAAGLDSRIVLARHLAEQAIWPCVDPLASRSRRLDAGLEGGSALAGELQELLRTYFTLQFSIDDRVRHTLSPDEAQQIQRARKALRFLSQPFFVAEPYTKRPGVSVSPDEARQVFAGILAGKYDETNKDAFYMAGAKPKAER